MNDRENWKLVAAVFFGMWAFRKYEEFRGDKEADPQDPRRFGPRVMRDMRMPPDINSEAPLEEDPRAAHIDDFQRGRR